MEFSTPRLSFQPVTVHDAEDLHQIRNREEVMKWSSTKFPEKDVTATRSWLETFVNVPHAVFAVREIAPSNSNSISNTDGKGEGEGERERGPLIGTMGARFMDSPVSLFKDTYTLTSSSPSPSSTSPSDAAAATATTTTTTTKTTEGAEHPKRWEVGYQYLPETWGKGYATESLRGFLAAWEGIRAAMAREGQEKKGHENDEGMGVLYAVTHRKNGPSQRVLLKAGFEVVGGFVDPKGTECVDFVYRFSSPSSTTSASSLA